MEVGSIIDNNLYIIRFEALPRTYDIHLPIVQKMIDSFKIMKPIAANQKQPSPTEQTPSSQAANTVKITLVDSSDRSIKYVRLYIKEYPEYGTPGSDSKGYTDLREAFWPDDAPYIGKVDMEITFPDNLFAKGEQFHVCIDKVTAPNEDNINIRCYELIKNTRIEYLTVNTGDMSSSNQQ
jgi:hypothetical protein